MQTTSLFRSTSRSPVAFRRSLSLRSVAAVAAVATTGFCALVWSNDSRAEGLYIGGSVGTPHFGDSIDGVSKGGNGLSGKAYFGYSFSPKVLPYFSLEAGYADLGRTRDATGRNTAHAEYLDGVGTLPLNSEWSLLGRVGIARVGINTPLRSDSGNGLKLGLGTEYKLTSNLALRGEWERYRANVVNTKADIDQYTVGVRWSF